MLVSVNARWRAELPAAPGTAAPRVKGNGTHGARGEEKTAPEESWPGHGLAGKRRNSRCRRARSGAAAGKAGAGPFLNSPTCPDGSFWSQCLERGDEQCEVQAPPWSRAARVQPALGKCWRNAPFLLLTKEQPGPAAPAQATAAPGGCRGGLQGLAPGWGGLQEGPALPCRGTRAWFSTDSHLEGLQRGLSGV